MLFSSTPCLKSVHNFASSETRFQFKTRKMKKRLISRNQFALHLTIALLQSLNLRLYSKVMSELRRYRVSTAMHQVNPKINSKGQCHLPKSEPCQNLYCSGGINEPIVEKRSPEQRFQKRSYKCIMGTVAFWPLIYFEN